MSVKLMLATSNVHKVAEIRQILPECYEIRSLADVGYYDEIPETGSTYVDNALIKSRVIHQKFGGNTLADDSGLEVEALGGKPGVFSARYAGSNCSSEDNINKLMMEMKGCSNRKARFKSVLALVFENNEYLFEGIVTGTITNSLSGVNGFGYDPVFIPEGYSETFAELSAELKNRLSHRGIAIRKMVDFLENERIVKL